MLNYPTARRFARLTDYTMHHTKAMLRRSLTQHKGNTMSSYVSKELAYIAQLTKTIEEKRSTIAQCREHMRIALQQLCEGNTAAARVTLQGMVKLS